MFKIISKYIKHDSGNIPLIITSSHGGDLKFNGINRRLSKPGMCLSNDFYTNAVVDKVLDHMKKLNMKPYYVQGLVNRKYCDLNRPIDEAFNICTDNCKCYNCYCSHDDSCLNHVIPQQYYNEYHNIINQYIKLMKQNHPIPLLLDIHGQSFNENTIFRGTQNSLSMQNLINKHGPEVLWSSDSICGKLQLCGIDVYPKHIDIDTDTKEHPKFNGGFTIRQYSGINGKTSNIINTIDCMQLEIGKDYRLLDNQMDYFCEVLADSLISFVNKYYE